MMCMVAAGLLSAPLFAADAGNGEDLFDTNCGDCHSLSAKVMNRKGPSLYHLIGRKAASLGGFKYSAAMAKSGISWTPQELDAYLAAPKGKVPGGIMKFKGLSKASDRADVIAYLASVR
jgi:cytochrome c